MIRSLKVFRFFVAISVVSLLLLEVTLRVMVGFGIFDERLPLFSVLRRSDFPDDWQRISQDPLFRRSEDPVLEYELIPNASRDDIRINSLGFRGSEVSSRPADGVIRIAVIGDSETFGAHLQADATFSCQIEGRLEEIYPGRKFEVLNFGVPGYHTLQEARLLNTRVLPLAPHVVMLRYSFNDPAIGEPQVLLESGWLRQSYAYLSWQLLTRQVTPLSAIWTEHEGDWPGFFLALHRSQYFDVVENLLLSMAANLQAHGIPFVLFVEPEVSAGIHETYPYGEIHEQLHALASGRFPVIDCLRPLRQACSDGKQLWHSEHDPHKNAFGNRIQGRFAADGLVPVFVETDLIP